VATLKEERSRKMKNFWFLLATALVFGISGVAFGYVGVGLDIECPGIPAGTTITIDGDLSDWAWAADYQYSKADCWVLSGDPVPDDDIDFVFNLAWSDEENMIYGAAAVTDDIYNADQTGWASGHEDDNLEFLVDGDNSGGTYQYGETPDYSNAQQIYLNPIFGLYCYGAGAHDDLAYLMGPPNEGAIGNQPESGDTDVSYTYEFKMLIYDALGDDIASSDDDVVHDLAEGDVIGFTLQWDDADETLKEETGLITRDCQYSTTDNGMSWTDASAFSNAVLIAAPTAVSPATWGSVKALFK